MSELVLGVTLGSGLLLVLLAWQDPERTLGHSSRARLGGLLAEAGLGDVTPMRLLGTCAGAGLAAAVMVWAVSTSWVIALTFGLMAAYAPIAWVRYRFRQRRLELRDLWPDAIENLASAVRAGLSLPEALSQLGDRGPLPLREPFRRFAEDYRVSGRFGDCLDALKDRLADPVGDRIVEALRMARDVGGNDLGRLLRTLAQFLRDDARTRAELESRQSWTVNAARLAVAAPWVLLGMIALRPEAVRAYDTTAGLIVLAVGGALSVIAYRLMVRLGRLPMETRVLR